MLTFTCPATILLLGMMQLEVCVCSLKYCARRRLCLCAVLLCGTDGAILWEQGGEFLHSPGGVARSAHSVRTRSLGPSFISGFVADA